MSDCCSSLKAEIAVLRAEVAKLKPVDENAIVARSVREANAFIMPKTEYLIAMAMASVAAELGKKILNVEGVANNALKVAGDALGKVGNALKSATEAAAAAKIAGTTANAAWAKWLAVGAAAVGIGGSVAAVNVLGGRVDAIDAALDATNSSVGNILGLLVGIKSQVQRAESKAGSANIKAEYAESTAQDARTLANKSYAIANDAKTTANKAISAAQKAVDTASTALTSAQQAKTEARSAKTTADKALTMAESVSGELSRLKPEVKEAKSLAQKAYETAIALSSRVSSLEKFRSYVEGQIIPQIGDLRGRIEQVAGQIIPLRSSIAQVTATVGGLSATVGGLVQIVPPLAGAIPNINGRIDRLEKAPPKVDTQTKTDIQQILRKLDALPALAVGAMIVAGLKPLSYTQTVTAAATGTCQTAAPSGCLGRALNNTENNIINRFGNLLSQLKQDALSKLIYAQTLANFAQLTLVQAKLGAQLKNGLSGGMNAIVNNQITQTVSNYVILAATFHNALMLSNDIAQTLFSAIDNVLKLMGIKVTNADGQPVNVGQKVSEFSSNFLKSLFGTANYQALTETWAKANRIYQAGINVINSFQGLANSILTGLEMTAGKVGKIGNALRAAGEVLDNAYSWMNPQPKFNRITQTLESLQQGASTIQMITQAPLDIINATTELTTATTELTNAIKQDENENNKGKEAPEPIQLKATKDAEKIASAGKQMTDTDLDPDEVVA